jgi:hypothetical protein
MSDKLKIMQEPQRLFGWPPIAACVNLASPEDLFYKFETCSTRVDYVEVRDWRGSLTDAIDRLKSIFGVNADDYHAGYKTPLIQKITVVYGRDVPQPDGMLVFVSLLDY